MTQTRKEMLVNDQYYHVFSRSIAKYVIFNDHLEFNRILELLKLYRFRNFNHKYSQFIELDPLTQASIVNDLVRENDVLAEIIAYCVMPTHFHLIIKQIADNGITKYMGRVLNGYSRFFNTSHNRVGPLWTGRFKSVLVSKDEQLLHLTRYIHLNPTSAGLVPKPEDWQYSSYHQYICDKNNHDIVKCDYEDVLEIIPKQYKRFVSDRKSYQRELSLIKNHLIDDYAG